MRVNYLQFTFAYLNCIFFSIAIDVGNMCGCFGGKLNMCGEGGGDGQGGGIRDFCIS